MAIPADLSPILSWCQSREMGFSLTSSESANSARASVTSNRSASLTSDQPDDAAMRGTEQDVGSESARKVLTDLVVALAEGDTSSDICADVL